MDVVAIVGIVLKAVGLFSAVATLTPNRSDNAIVDLIYRFINVLGMNFGNAKNEVD